MSVLTRGIRAAAETSSTGLTTGIGTDAGRSTWGEVGEQAHRLAAGLASRGVSCHGSVAVLATDPAEVAPLAQAIWLRRAALTMLQHPTPRGDLAVWLADTVRAIKMVRADVVVVGEAFLSAADHLSAHNLAVCGIASLSESAPIDPAEIDEAEETDIALRQLTSGSTGAPKAVEISHSNVAVHTVVMRDALDVNPETDILASWVPLSHDMGMLAFLCLPMQLGVETACITPEQFLRRPLSWAELIDENHATMTAGPNFAYSVLARHFQRAEPGQFDLSSLRVAAFGAEPLNHRDIADFTAAGARFGLRPTAPTSAYGIAEATLTVSLGAPHEQPIIDRVSRTALEDGCARPVRADSTDAQHIVCLGFPGAGMDLRVTRDREVLGPREVGTIELRGPLVAEHYLTPDGIIDIAGHDGWFDTGDLGYLDEQGRVYVCGRTKDLIVLAGRNLYPHDIERAAENVDGVRKGSVIAVRIDAEREGFAVLAEVHSLNDEDARLRIRRDITAQVNRRVGRAPREVRLFPAGTLPKTASGKLRRNAARALLDRAEPGAAQPNSAPPTD
ncbi:MAG: long-chain-fatty-acid--CoA ligase [Mycolicibacterium sp.]|uniref:long-chain-fatty-acid--CoA ligase n=1 Tax=Mycolicibacterium sp. TaxID=2320850 RepID=UPI003D09B0C8